MYGAASVIATAIILPLLGFAAVCLRFHVRLHVRPSYVGIDDWLILASSVLVWGQGANQVVAAAIGLFGRNSEPVIEWRAKNQLKINYANMLFEKATYCTIKLSVLFFYRRIFIHQTAFRIWNDALIVLVTLWGIIFFVLILLYGKNASSPQEWTSLWFGIIDVVGDIAILAMPYPYIRKLHMSRASRIGVSAIFLLGTLSLIFGIVRLVFVADSFLFFFSPTSDKSKIQIAPLFWTTVEVSVGLLAACLPPMGPLIRSFPNPLRLYFIIRQNFAIRSRDKTANLKRVHGNDRYAMLDHPKVEMAGRELYDPNLQNIQKPTGLKIFVQPGP